MRLASFCIALGLSAVAGCSDSRYRLGGVLDSTPVVPAGTGGGAAASAGAGGSIAADAQGSGDSLMDSGAGTAGTADGSTSEPEASGGSGPIGGDAAGAAEAGVTITGAAQLACDPTLSRILADEEHVYSYWREELWRMDHSGGSLEKLAEAIIQHVVADATHLYWYTDSDIRRVAKAGGPTEIVTELRIDGWLGGPLLALDDSHVLVSTFGGRTVLRAPKTGGAPEIVAISAEPISGVAINQGAVYWAEYSFVGGVYRTDLTTGTPAATTTLFLPMGGVTLHAAASDLWFTSLRSADGALVRAPFDGGPFTNYPVANTTPLLESDNTHLYVSSSQFQRINLMTGVQQVITAVPHVAAGGLALTQAWIFVIDDACIFRLPKPPP